MIARRLLTLIRPHNDNGANIRLYAVLLVGMSVTGVVVAVVDERLVKICHIVSAMMDEI